MKTSILVALCLVLASTTAVISGGRSDDPLGVAVSPQLLILGVAQGGYVTVHTDGLPFSQVVGSSVTLNDVPAASVFADDCGDLVAKFKEAEIEALVSPPSAVLTLAGVKTDGTTFSGSDTVKVIASKKKK